MNSYGFATWNRLSWQDLLFHRTARAAAYLILWGPTGHLPSSFSQSLHVADLGFLTAQLRACERGGELLEEYRK